MSASSFPRDPILPPVHERAGLLVFCGATGLLAHALFAAGVIVVQSLVTGHDPHSMPVSDLARGPHGAWGNALLYTHAAGCVALALGASHAHLGRLGWSAGTVALTLVACTLVTLALWDDFNARPEVHGYTVHTRVSFLLFPLFLFGPLGMAPGASRAGGGFGRILRLSAAAWPLGALMFVFGPEEARGLFQRLGGLATLLWTGTLGWLLLSLGRARARVAR